MTHKYRIEIKNERDYNTLCWLADRGYDGDFLKLADLIDENEETGRRVYEMEEHKAWEFSENAENEGFLSCNGSETLQDSLIQLWEEIA